MKNAELCSFLALACISVHVSGHQTSESAALLKVRCAYYISSWWSDGWKCLATDVNSRAEILAF